MTKDGIRPMPTPEEIEERAEAPEPEDGGPGDGPRDDGSRPEGDPEDQAD